MMKRRTLIRNGLAWVLVSNLFFVFTNNSHAITRKPAGARGVLVKVDPDHFQHSEKMEKLAAATGLKKDRVISPFSMRVFKRTKEATDKSLLQFCEAIKKIPGVIYCEEDDNIPTNRGPTEVRQPSSQAPPRSKQTTHPPGAECPLVPNIPHPISTQQPVKGLSDFWAQEFTGADLLRHWIAQKSSNAGPGPKTDAAKSPIEIGVVDTITKDENHGELVQSLIVSDGPFAPLTTAAGTMLFFQNRYVTDMVDIALTQQQQGRFPAIVNQSMYWQNKQSIYDAVKVFLTHGSLWVTSAGNYNAESYDRDTPVEPLKIEASRNQGVILVGSSSILGHPSILSQPSEEIAILAPSDFRVLSQSKKGPELFSGTSGASPQVAAALAAFEWLSGHHLTPEQAKSLLRSTAIPSHFSYNRPANHGPGLLNTYKIGRIAEVLSKKCQGEKNQSECFATSLSQSWHLPPDAQHTIEAKQHFLTCFPEMENSTKPAVIQPSNPATCEQRRTAFSFLRAEALLHPEDVALWNGLGCIYDQLGFKINALYYKNIANASTLSASKEYLQTTIVSPEVPMAALRALYLHPLLHEKPELVSQKILAEKNFSKEIRLGRFFLEQPRWWQDAKLVAAMTEKADPFLDKWIAETVLANRRWEQHPELVLQMIRKGTVDGELEHQVLQQTHWKNHSAFLQILKGDPLSVENLRRHLFD